MARDKNILQRWTYKQSSDLYDVGNWGAPYFSISEAGEVQVRLRSGGHNRDISLAKMLDDLMERGVDLPVLLRFSDILDNRITRLHAAFNDAIKRYQYRGVYRGVFPIKVNQQHHVIEEIAAFGERYHHGLEAGSKAELIVAMAYIKDPAATIVCNGYKDAEYIDLALSARAAGLNTILVVEMLSEVDLIRERAEALEVEPVLGVRVKLSTQGCGQWGESGGDRSVFGLNAAQMIELLNTLREHGTLSQLRMLHYHLGSQVPKIRALRAAAAEAVRFYVDLVKEGAPMGLIDIGGGLAVDFDGTQSGYTGSSNYRMEEYCDDIIEVIASTVNEAGLEHPDIISESGRATVAHYAVMLLNIMDYSRYEPEHVPDKADASHHEMTQSLFEIMPTISTRNLQECLNDALYYRDEIRSLFQHGTVSLKELGAAEQMFSCIMSGIKDLSEDVRRRSPEMEKLEEYTADIYYGNFSLFQSLPDVWAIDQVFPVMPIHYLNEQPTRRGILSDLTCDSDGRIDHFITAGGISRTLPLHTLDGKSPYVLGVFYVGAYQETLGDLHNLFGDPNVMAVQLDEEGNLEIAHEVEGDAVADVLSYVEYEPKHMVALFKKQAERSFRSGLITASMRRHIVETYEKGMRGYTYLKHHSK